MRADQNDREAPGERGPSNVISDGDTSTIAHVTDRLRAAVWWIDVSRGIDWTFCTEDEIRAVADAADSLMQAIDRAEDSSRLRQKPPIWEVPC